MCTSERLCRAKKGQTTSTLKFLCVRNISDDYKSTVYDQYIYIYIYTTRIQGYIIVKQEFGWCFQRGSFSVLLLLLLLYKSKNKKEIVWNIRLDFRNLIFHCIRLYIFCLRDRKDYIIHSPFSYEYTLVKKITMFASVTYGKSISVRTLYVHR